jgi:hypothetical protein
MRTHFTPDQPVQKNDGWKLVLGFGCIVVAIIGAGLHFNKPEPQADPRKPELTTTFDAHRDIPITPAYTLKDAGYVVQIGQVIADSRGAKQFSVPVYADAVGPTPSWVSCKLLDEKGRLVGGGGLGGLVPKGGANMDVTTSRPLAKGSLSCSIVPRTLAAPTKQATAL